MVSVDTVTVASLLPKEDATLVGCGVGNGVGAVTMTGVGEMHSSIQYSGQEYLISSEQLLAGLLPTSESQSTVISFVQSGTMDSGVGIDVGRGVGH